VTFRALLFLVTTVLVAALSSEAFAQTVTIGANITRRTGRPSGLPLTAISYADCVAPAPNEDEFNVGLTLQGVTTQGLQVWAAKDGSSSCTSAESRSTLIGSQCWLVFSENTAPTELSIRTQDIVPHNASGEGSGTAEACDVGTSGKITLFFILFDGDSQASTTAAPLAVTYDLKGPEAPTDLGISLGDTRLFPTWEESSATDEQGYRIYCEPATGDCTAANLVAGEIPDSTLSEKGTGGPSATSGEASGLTNYQQYACAVAAYDDLENVGPLSELVCGRPEPVEGYFKGYRAAGGKAGGGYCAFGRSGPEALAGLSALLAALALARRRQRGAAQ
jgi:hypothetical protein